MGMKFGTETELTKTKSWDNCHGDICACNICPADTCPTPNFVKTTPKPHLKDNDMNIEGNGLGTAGLQFSLSMCTAGQSTALEEHLGM